jgi:hypothetical protein
MSQLLHAGDVVMGTEEQSGRTGEGGRATAAQFADVAEANEVRAWEQIDAGRYMPRRIKGSCKGRALG